MTVQTDLDDTWTSNIQTGDAFNARAVLEDASRNIDEVHQKIQALVDSGNFNTIPVDMRSALNDWWTIIKTARSSIGSDSDIMTLLNWTPPQS